MTATDERREDERVEIFAVAIVLARHNPAVSMTIESLSVGGARLAGPATFEKDERIQILFEVDGSPIEVLGDVVRVDRDDMLTDRIAVRFVSLNDEHRKAIRVLVRRTLELEEEQLSAERGI